MADEQFYSTIIYVYITGTFFSGKVVSSTIVHLAGALHPQDHIH